MLTTRHNFVAITADAEVNEVCGSILQNQALLNLDPILRDFDRDVDRIRKSDISDDEKCNKIDAIARATRARIASKCTPLRRNLDDKLKRVQSKLFANIPLPSSATHHRRRRQEIRDRMHLMEPGAVQQLLNRAITDGDIEFWHSVAESNPTVRRHALGISDEQLEHLEEQLRLELSPLAKKEIDVIERAMDIFEQNLDSARGVLTLAIPPHIRAERDMAKRKARKAKTAATV